jgi:anti-sigma factor ChrR (cupin superfamily)
MKGYLVFYLHPDPEQIAAYLAGGIESPIEYEQVQVHLLHCDPCQSLAGRVMLTTSDLEQSRDQWGA